MLCFFTQFLLTFNQMQVQIFYYDTVDPYYVKCFYLDFFVISNYNEISLKLPLYSITFYSR